MKNSFCPSAVATGRHLLADSECTLASQEVPQLVEAQYPVRAIGLVGGGFARTDTGLLRRQLAIFRGFYRLVVAPTFLDRLPGE